MLLVQSAWSQDIEKLQTEYEKVGKRYRVSRANRQILDSVLSGIFNCEDGKEVLQLFHRSVTMLLDNKVSLTLMRQIAARISKVFVKSQLLSSYVAQMGVLLGESMEDERIQQEGIKQKGIDGCQAGMQARGFIDDVQGWCGDWEYETAKKKVQVTAVDQNDDCSTNDKVQITRLSSFSMRALASLCSIPNQHNQPHTSQVFNDHSPHQIQIVSQNRLISSQTIPDYSIELNYYPLHRKNLLLGNESFQQRMIRQQQQDIRREILARREQRKKCQAGAEYQEWQYKMKIRDLQLGKKIGRRKKKEKQ